MSAEDVLVGFSGLVIGDAVESTSPTPEEVLRVAAEHGYVEFRPSVSATLYLVEAKPPEGQKAVKIHVYYTTRSIMTYLHHPKTGTNRLWRSNAYQNLEELAEFFKSPRLHSGKGYRKADNAVRACVECGKLKGRTEYSPSQWKKGPDLNKCTECINAKQQEDSKPPPAATLTLGLTDTVLQEHNKRQTRNQQRVSHDKLERRQFHCPDCPRFGRGQYMFFKRVPPHKPIVKCPQCKRATQGRCKRLYPVPRGSEKGYGLFKCTVCNDKWGSSRAVSNVAQECYSCLRRNGQSNMVTPFRLEIHKKKKGRTGRRIPREPIAEGKPEERGYGEQDQQRNFSGGGNALLKSRDTDGFEIVPRSAASASGGSQTSDSWQEVGSVTSSSPSVAASVNKQRIPSGYKHRCAGCATGVCKNRRVPVSKVHEVSDGNTVSTRASLVTNSSVDKTDYVDRDEDFSGFEDNWAPE